MLDNERMEVLVKADAARQRSVKHVLESAIAFFSAYEFHASERAARVGINDEIGLSAGVEQDRVSSLWADAFNRQKLLARGGLEKIIKRVK